MTSRADRMVATCSELMTRVGQIASGVDFRIEEAMKDAITLYAQLAATLRADPDEDDEDFTVASLMLALADRDPGSGVVIATGAEEWTRLGEVSVESDCVVLHPVEAPSLSTP